MTSSEHSMEIKSPVFLNCFARGGSNILWNVLLSHPGFCSPIHETYVLFRRGLRPTGWIFTALCRQWRYFDPWYLQERRPVGAVARGYIDKVLHRNRMRTLEDAEMRFAAEDREYRRDEVERARLVAKNNNGLVFLSAEFQRMYPDAVFVAMARHPLALYESYRRRRLCASTDEFVDAYTRIAERMLDDRDHLRNCHLIRFEDLLRDPLTIARQLYGWVGADLGDLPKLRFKAKPHYTANGDYTSQQEANRHHWFALSEVPGFLEQHINQFQESRISSGDREAVLEPLKPLLARLGYT